MLATHQSEFISVAEAFELENTKSKNNGQEKAFDRSTKHVATGNVGFKALSFQVPCCGVSHMEVVRRSH